MRVISIMAADGFTCEDLKSETTQLGIILYPPDRLNEKFLIKIRQCILKLPEDHPVKVWLKNVARPEKLTPEEQKQAAFITEILTSKFNLITDLTVKKKIIEVIIDVPENTFGERLMKSYLYLMIGNVTRSDNILRAMMKEPPYKSWKGFSANPSFYHRLAIQNIDPIITKIAQHPSDRKTWELYGRYLKEFTNDPRLLEELNDNETNHLEGKFSLESVKRISPEIVHFLRLKRMDEKNLAAHLRTKEIPMAEQAWWEWYFLPINSVISEEFLPELASIEEKEPLWFIYLMENEKLSDFYSAKTGKAFLPGKRQMLRENLNHKETFMLALWKLIELGDIDQRLVNETSHFLAHE
jgi:hypothetical protein